jgi:CheY-like chemotaxis protein
LAQASFNSVESCAALCGQGRLDGFCSALSLLFPPLFVAAENPFPAQVIQFQSDVYLTVTNTIPSQRILVVDDEPSVRESIRMILNADGHQVETVSSGTEALEKLAKGDYDVVFTDHIMGGMSGEELARAIKAKYPVQIVIMLTAYADVLDRSTQRRPLVDFVLTKPIDILLLRLMLLRLTSQKTLASSVRL